MDPRELARNNSYIGPGSFSIDLLYMNLTPSTNWGVPSGPSYVVTLNPQVDTDLAGPQFSIYDAGVELRPEFLKRRVRRKVMAEIANEFAVWNDDLLRQLAQ